MVSWLYSTTAPVLFLTAGLLGQTGASSQTPEGWVRVGADSVKLALMGSCWEVDELLEEEEDITICADTWHMFREPDSLDLHLVEVDPGESLGIFFSRPPNGVTIMPYTGRGFEADPDLDPSRFPAPTSPGTHYYAVSAEWEPGNGMWMFKVEVGRGGSCPSGPRRVGRYSNTESRYRT